MTKPGRQGINEQQILDAISQLQDEGQDPSPAKVRNIIGSGSYSTIGAVLSKWRDEQQATSKADVPEPSPAIQRLFRQLWMEANKAASEFHHAERKGFEAERSLWEKTRAELTAEIMRLESSIEILEQENARTTQALDQSKQQLLDQEKETATAATRAETLESEMVHLRDERKRAEQNVAQLTERAARAEALLSQQGAKSSL